MEAKLGFHVSCTDCHAQEATAQLRRPDHAACARCHAPESALSSMPAMGECLRCHQPETPPSSRSRTLIHDDLVFSHQAHRNDRRGKFITCSTCHAETTQADADDMGKHAAPVLSVCVKCHDNAERVPEEKRMSRCELCHSTRSAGLGSLAPRSHMPATERPPDHTSAFRRDHASDARLDARRCARCHGEVSGNRRNTCDECHQVMRPSDHFVDWKEYGHGPEAATDTDRCTTCHQVDYCVSCHRRPPRSHFPPRAFRDGHGVQAAMNMRPCITCHRPERDCARAGCHRGGLL